MFNFLMNLGGKVTQYIWGGIIDMRPWLLIGRWRLFTQDYHTTLVDVLASISCSLEPDGISLPPLTLLRTAFVFILRSLCFMLLDSKGTRSRMYCRPQHYPFPALSHLLDKVHNYKTNSLSSNTELSKASIVCYHSGSWTWEYAGSYCKCWLIKE